MMEWPNELGGKQKQKAKRKIRGLKKSNQNKTKAKKKKKKIINNAKKSKHSLNISFIITTTKPLNAEDKYCYIPKDY